MTKEDKVKKPHPSIASHTAPMGEKKRIGLVAHDFRKRDLIDWADYNRDILMEHELFGTGTTGGLLADKLDLPVHRFMSGPLGGDLQIGASIAESKLDILIFFWDPLMAQPHDVDVKALLRISIVYNIALACDRTSADFLITSDLLNKKYDRFLVDYGDRLKSLKVDE
ncbi:MAG: methylglyoxal synthase [Rhodohalobacter sp.]|nr:methylglyoxal synthase [Rhodohalobacter sp.]MDZ7756657.1 methylglyoxal synthase [Rhodohalobacter sp.]